MQYIWKDQNVVLFMNTISNDQKNVKCFRRKSTKIVTNAHISRAIFGDSPIKEFEIPVFIDIYNHYMNEVDNADQLRNYYSIQQMHFKNWKPF